MELKRLKATSLIGCGTLLLLTGCGDATNAELASNNFKDVDHSKTVVYRLDAKEGTILDYQVTSNLRLLGNNGFLTRTSDDLSYPDKLISRIEDHKASLNDASETIPQEIFDLYIEDLTKTQEDLEKRKDFYASLYGQEGLLAKHIESTYTEEFDSVKTAEDKIAERNAFVQKEQDTLNAAIEGKKKAQDDLKALNDNLKASIAEFIVNNDIAYNASRVSTMWSARFYSPDNKDACVNGRQSWSSYEWNEEHKVCYRSTESDNNGLDSSTIESLTSEQSKELDAIVNSKRSQAIELIVMQGKYLLDEKASEKALDNRNIIATNRFGTDYDLKRNLSNAQREVQNKTKRVYSFTNGVSESRNRSIRMAQSVYVDALRDTHGVPKEVSLSQFNNENAAKTVAALLLDSQAKMVEVEVNKKGRLELVQDNPFDQLYIKFDRGHGAEYARLSPRNHPDNQDESMLYIHRGSEGKSFESVLLKQAGNLNVSFHQGSHKSLDSFLKNFYSY
ncbi:hypothetical protein [Vibrio maerlii]|uniref:hypothetical protein n=1 Tax=Vibrio maerlii TaxID=2231648 RepID=UPI000E3C97A7|nr:hypothetical protein [Vibrio maerlii]